MLELDRPVLENAEAAATAGAAAGAVLAILRELPMEDFGLFLIGLPNAQYPSLSRVLPPMASTKVQESWTGSSGLELYRQTTAFVRVVESNYARHAGLSLAGKTILDFGCGYGRILRQLYYYTDPENIWGVDAWQRSLDHCKQDKLPGNFALSQPVPESLPVGDTKFDLMVSFSVFTHLAPDAAKACLAALRKHIAPDGLLMVTIRPIEFWRFIDGIRKTNRARELENAHRESGLAYLPHAGAEGQTYGDISLEPRFFETNEWRVCGLDRSVADPFQVTCVLAPKGT